MRVAAMRSVAADAECDELAAGEDFGY